MIWLEENENSAGGGGAGAGDGGGGDGGGGDAGAQLQDATGAPKSLRPEEAQLQIPDKQSDAVVHAACARLRCRCCLAATFVSGRDFVTDV